MEQTKSQSAQNPVWCSCTFWLGEPAFSLLRTSAASVPLRVPSDTPSPKNRSSPLGADKDFRFATCLREKLPPHARTHRSGLLSDTWSCVPPTPGKIDLKNLPHGIPGGVTHHNVCAYNPDHSTQPLIAARSVPNHLCLTIALMLLSPVFLRIFLDLTHTKVVLKA